MAGVLASLLLAAGEAEDTGRVLGRLLVPALLGYVAYRLAVRADRPRRLAVLVGVAAAVGILLLLGLTILARQQAGTVLPLP